MQALALAMNFTMVYCAISLPFGVSKSTVREELHKNKIMTKKLKKGIDKRGKGCYTN